jgi:hypothetical protein
MDLGHQLVRVGCDNRERPGPLTGCRVLPILPQARNPQRRAVLHCSGIGLLRAPRLDRFPLVEAVHRQDASAQAVRIPECRQRAHRLTLGVNGLAPTAQVLAPVGNEAPSQRIKRPLQWSRPRTANPATPTNT